MCNSNKNDLFGNRKREPSEKVKFYRNLRSFIIFNMVMAGLWIMGSGFGGLWFVAKIWGVFLFIHYLKVNGMPGTKGWLSDDWSAWMEERESRRPTHETWDEEPEPIVHEPRRRRKEKVWQERDLV
ncbi:MAG: 2TM domain-containing protein [Saprospiraceae bacterium]